ncbi:alpha/beta hydrolase [Micromonospora inositola]|uniref:Acetyl esterase/lipase n=1 Tax=Micromonospora inositola TaxID=47865 RepID=A0A1C5J346_9ACTN|nr:alpha/beta hydrolase [Micromonospora inositola]SCG64599.1 Acetyl esterase/lipase [Micromonospora inositola]
MALPFYQTPFVLSPPPAPAERHGRVDLHLPADDDGPCPAVVLVHGGPLPPGAPDPRDWLVYLGYGALLAEQGVVAAVVSHRLHTLADYPVAAGDVAEAVDLIRADPRVDPDRLVLWFFSGGGLLLADWLRERPAWLRGVAATYPLLTPLPGWEVDARFRPIDALDATDVPPIVLTRAGLDRPEILAGTEAFTAAAARRGTPVRLVEVPDGRHGFDALDQTDQSRAAVLTARDAILEMLKAL